MKKKGMWKKLEVKLKKIYSKVPSRKTTKELKKIVKNFKTKIKNQPELDRKFNLSSNDIALITYANSLKERSLPTLKALDKFIRGEKLDKYINTVHILPFHPWDTDRGFSVKNYHEVKKTYGNWKNIEIIADKVNLMFDFVANHASIENPLVQNALIERHLKVDDHHYPRYSYYKDFVIAFSDKDKPIKGDLKNLARPRPNPVLTKYSVVENKKKKLKAILGDPKNENVNILGTGWVWTTFSRPKNSDGTEDTRQVDLNFANPKVLIEAIKILLFYIEKGARLIRLDAVGYIWKELGSTSLHERQAHLILEIIHDVISFATPGVVTIAEVNEPQKKVLEYLGKEGRAESDLVYQFTHFPLAVYAILTSDARPYKKWLETIDKFNGRQFITVLGTHDGMGLKPARGFLTDLEINRLTDILVRKHNALPNHAHLPGGREIVYEICATPFNLINSPNTKTNFEIQLKRYLVVLALGLVIPGLPAIYINGLLGSSNYKPKKGLDENRTINREVFDYKKLSKKINNEEAFIGATFKEVTNLLKIRKDLSVIDPDGKFLRLKTNNQSVISAVNTGEGGKHKLLSIVNVSDEDQVVRLDLPSSLVKNKLTDRLTDRKYQFKNKDIHLEISPYQILWLVPLT